MTLSAVMFAPFPPTRNGIADYANDLATALTARGLSLLVVIADDAPEPIPSSSTIMREAEYLKAGLRNADRVHIYHLGNNLDCLFVLRRLRDRPGILILHDCSLFDLIQAYGSCHPGLVDILRASTLITFGSTGLSVVDESIASSQMSGALRHVAASLALPIAYASRVIVHSEFAASVVVGHSTTKLVDVIPHYTDIAERPRAERRTEARRRLGLSPADFIFVSAGLLTRAKCVELMLQALGEGRSHISNLRLLLVGGQSGLDVGALIEALGATEWASHVGHVENAELIAYLDAADILLNLRSPTSGETSGILCRALGRGVCAIVHKHGWYAELPADSVFHVGATVDAAALAAVVFFLYRRPLARLKIEIEAARFARLTMGTALVAERYLLVIQAQALSRHTDIGRTFARNVEDFVASNLLTLRDIGAAPVTYLAGNSRLILDRIFERSARAVMLNVPSLSALDRALQILALSIRQFELALVFVTVDLDVNGKIEDITQCFHVHGLALLHELISIKISPCRYSPSSQAIRLIVPLIRTSQDKQVDK